MDGHSRYGRCRCSDWHSPHVCQTECFCSELLHHWRGGRFVGLCLFGCLGASGFSVDISFKLLFMVIIGGMGSIMGSFFGAAFIVLLPIFLSQFLPFLGGLFGLEVTTAAASHAELMIFGA
jgi:branched-chain amino acid transport system permease protein